MRRERPTADSDDSEWGVWDGPSMDKYEQVSRQRIPRVGPSDVHGRSNQIGFPNRNVLSETRLAKRALAVAKREGLNFHDPAARLMAYVLAEKETGYRGAEIDW